MTQFAFGQEQALQGAAQHIQALEQQLAAARQGPDAGSVSAAARASPGSRAASSAACSVDRSQQSEGQAPYARPYQQQGPGYAQQQPGFGAPPPGYSPGYGYGPQGMMAQRGGSGFLGSALTTAAGVAGGMLAFNAIEGLFSNQAVAESDRRRAPSAPIRSPPAASTRAAGPNVPADQGGADPSGWGAGSADNSGWQTVPDQSVHGRQYAAGRIRPINSAPDDGSGGGGGWDDSGGGGNSDWT